MIVIATGGKRKDQLARGFDPRLARLVGKAHHAVGIRDEQGIADQRHTKRLIEVFQKNGTCLGYTIAIGIAQQHDAILAHSDRPGSNHVLPYTRWLL